MSSTPGRTAAAARGCHWVPMICTHRRFALGAHFLLGLRRREVRIGGAASAIIVLLVLAVKALSGGGEPDKSRSAAPVATAPQATPPAPPRARCHRRRPRPPSLLRRRRRQPRRRRRPNRPRRQPRRPSPSRPSRPQPPQIRPRRPAKAPAQVQAEEKREPAEEEPAAEKKPDSPAKGKFPVVIKSEPDGTHVATGKHVFGTTPLTLKLRPGNSYEFTFTKAGYTPLVRRYRFDAEEGQTLRVTLKKMPEPAKKPAPSPSQAKSPAPAPSRRPKKSSFFTR